MPHTGKCGSLEIALERESEPYVRAATKVRNARYRRHFHFQVQNARERPTQLDGAITRRTSTLCSATYKFKYVV